jgi:ABC-type transport system involved in cytochrome bd biosynthesis fused ATPase/permease subunit
VALPRPAPVGSAALVLLLLVACGLLCGALLVLYSNAFRRRYSEEMRRDFRELMLEGLQEGGTAAQAKPRASWRKSCF